MEQRISEANLDSIVRQPPSRLRPAQAESVGGFEQPQGLGGSQIAPVPGFIAHPLAIAPGEGQLEMEAGAMALEPGKGSGAFEAGGKVGPGLAAVAKINSVTSAVL